jgi:uncharacterized membrane protein YqiK
VWGILIALGAAYGLVRLAAAKPDIRRALDERRLVVLKRKLAENRLDRTEAADGAYLARQDGNAELERKFKTVAETLRKTRQE